jgi:uncharacterized protein YqgC (DUF456 family)
MEMFWVILGLAAIVLGIAGVVLPLLPGMPLLFGGFWLLAWSDGFVRVGEWTIVLLGALALLAWGIDYVAATLGVKRVGASGKAVVGAAIGTVLGLAAGLVGVIVGPVLGAIAGEWLARRDSVQASRAGLAAGISFLLGIVAKIGIAFTMLGIFAVAWFV